LLSCGYQYQANSGTGRSFGPELEVVAKIADDWLISAGGNYTDARVTHPNAQFVAFLTGPTATTLNGNAYCPSAASCTAPIMNVPRTSASASITYTKGVWNDYNFSARLADTFTGPSRDESFYYAIPLPSYNLMNLRFGLSSERWSSYLYIDNLTNKVAEISANNTSFQFNVPGVIRFSTNQPRTFGTQLNYKF
jgi:outer membrane receptor protein involved in Fe transport